MQAKASRNTALARIREQHRLIEDRMWKMQQQEGQEVNKRLQSIMVLKRSTDEAARQMKVKNAENAHRLRQREEAQRKEFDELLAAGQNPYEVFRMRSLVAQQKKERRQREKVGEPHLTYTYRMSCC